jgi:hypothetical protein
MMQLYRSALVAACLCLGTWAQGGTYQLKSGPGVKNPSGGTISYTNTKLPYLGSSSGYGASASDAYFVDCQGTITVEWEWCRLGSPIPTPTP